MFFAKKYPPQDRWLDEQVLATELTIARVVLSNEIQYSDIFTSVNNSIVALLKRSLITELFCIVFLSWESIVVP